MVVIESEVMQLSIQIGKIKVELTFFKIKIVKTTQQ